MYKKVDALIVKLLYIITESK